MLENSGNGLLQLNGPACPKMPLRIGYSWGGGDLKELGMGFGVRRGLVMFDFGFAFRNGMWLHTMKGFNLSFGITFVGKEKDPKK